MIYLASQIRQNSNLVRSSTTTATGQQQAAFNILLIQDPEVARIFWDGIRDRDGLSDADRRRFDPMINLQLQSFFLQYEFSGEGVGSTRVMEQQEAGVRWSMHQPGVQQWWREWGATTYPGDFGQFVDGLIREGEAAG